MCVCVCNGRLRERARESLEYSRGKKLKNKEGTAVTERSRTSAMTSEKLIERKRRPVIHEVCEEQGEGGCIGLEIGEQCLPPLIIKSLSLKANYKIGKAAAPQ